MPRRSIRRGARSSGRRVCLPTGLAFRLDGRQMRFSSVKLNELFHRVTSGGKFVPEIDGLRFVAIAAVIAYHLNGTLVRYYNLRLPSLPAILLLNGERGVWLFFVISGFILALPFASHRLRGTPAPDLKHYFLRRLTRLEPPYVINILICGLLLFVVNHVALASLLPHLLASLLYSHTFFYGDLSTINPVTWSLEVEVQFYLTMPLLALVFAVRKDWARRIILIAAMVISAVAQILWAHSFRSQFSIAYFIQFFLAGFLLADLRLSYADSYKKWWWDALSVMGWPIVFLMEGPILR